MTATAVTLFVIGTKTSRALEFKTQAEKIAWIKNAIKDKTFKPDYKEADDKYYKGGYYTAEEKQFMREFLKDFLAQTNIEYVEPIATGDSIDDPAIAKFNTSCPNKKPMNVGLEFSYSHPYEMTDEMLEAAREKAPSRGSYKCKSHFRIFKFNIFNTNDNKEEYILYCDNVTASRIEYGHLMPSDVSEWFSMYLHIFPNQCLNSREIWSTPGSMEKNVVLAVLRHRGLYYLCGVSVYPKVTEIHLVVWKKGTFEWARFYSFNNKEKVK
jgi:hypothetical protein